MKNNGMGNRAIAVLVRALLGATVGCVGAAHAADFGATIDAGVGYSDNIDTAPDELAIEEKMTRAGLNLVYLEDTRRLNADVLADLMYVDYLDHTFESEVIGNAAADVTLGLVPERFQWQISDNFGQLRSDRFAPASRTNRENINVFSTGPDLLFRLGARTGVRISGRYGRTDFEESTQNEDSRTGTLALTRELAGGSTLGLVGEASKYDFEVETFTDFDRRNAYLNYEFAGSRTTLGVDIGYTVIDFGERSNDGLLGRVSLARRVSPSSILTFGLGTRFSASGDVFRRFQRRLPGRYDIQPTLAVADVFRSRNADLGWSFARARTEFGITVSYSTEEYEQQTEFNRDMMIANVSLVRELGRGSTFDLTGLYHTEDFDNGIDAKTLRLSAGFSWDLGRHLVLSTRVLRYDRNSHQANTEYVENQAWFVVGYRVGQTR